jgi:hypothetical protein
VTAFGILAHELEWRVALVAARGSCSESAVVAHFSTCAVAAAIADTISAIQSKPRQSLPGGALELSEGSRTTKRSRRCLSRCVKPHFWLGGVFNDCAFKWNRYSREGKLSRCTGDHPSDCTQQFRGTSHVGT